MLDIKNRSNKFYLTLKQKAKAIEQKFKIYIKVDCSGEEAINEKEAGNKFSRDWNYQILKYDRFISLY